MTSQFTKSLLGGAVLALTASGSAWAADLGPYQPYSPPPSAEVVYGTPSIWQGAYIGINGGYGWSNSTFTEPEGGFGGGQLGYNWQRDRFVFGLEGDIQAADISGRAYNPFDDATAHSNVNWFSTVRGRLGFTAGSLLIYGTGGLAVADFDNKVDVGGLTFRDNDTKVGYAAGGGVEWAFAPNWSMKAEYLYLGFGDEKLSSGYRINDDFQTVRVGLNYKFW
ncbi:outer membrane protein [Hyphomicrobium sp.]|uniref:outer membrane protein n=1 Tax=Hyphomicrobium sp. TaxID=82 RepID=UPI000FA8E880|nr:outer membrane protein [Hyphomicrobium sp.]RUO97240.1 MAG: porin family protein [Hyphomicrobium sp.]